MTISKIQDRASASGSVDQSLAFTSDVTTGSLLLVSVGESANHTNDPVVTDTLGTAYAKVVEGGSRTSLFFGIAPSSGPNTVAVDSDNASATRMKIEEYGGSWPADPRVGTPSANTITASPHATPSIDPGEAALVIGVCRTNSDVTYSSAGSGFTLGTVALLRLTTGYQIVGAAGSVNAEFAFTGTPNGGQGLIAAFAEEILGPTIDTQPVADVVLINGDPTRASASFTVAATASAGSLSYQWQLEDSVGAGTYTNIASGSGATWSGGTTATLTGTFTAKTLTGRKVRCNVTDDNGTTTSDAVLLTIYTGPVLSKSSGTTNASGVDTLTITSDYPNTAEGEFTVVTATCGGVSKEVALVYQTP